MLVYIYRIEIEDENKLKQADGRFLIEKIKGAIITVGDSKVIGECSPFKFKFNDLLNIYDLSDYSSKYGIRLVYEDSYDDEILKSISLIKERMKELIDTDNCDEHFVVLYNCVKELKEIDVES